MNEKGDHGTLNGGEWYKVVVYFQEGPLWATQPPAAKKITFICVGHSMGGSKWMLDNASPDQPLPPRYHTKAISHQPTLPAALRRALGQVTGKDVRGVEYNKVEEPEKGAGSFWGNGVKHVDP